MCWKVEYHAWNVKKIQVSPSNFQSWPNSDWYKVLSQISNIDWIICRYNSFNILVDYIYPPTFLIFQIFKFLGGSHPAVHLKASRNRRKFRLFTWNSFISQFFHSVGERWGYVILASYKIYKIKVILSNIYPKRNIIKTFIF